MILAVFKCKSMTITAKNIEEKILMGHLSKKAWMNIIAFVFLLSQLASCKLLSVQIIHRHGFISQTIAVFHSLFFSFQEIGARYRIFQFLSHFLRMRHCNSLSFCRTPPHFNGTLLGNSHRLE